MMEQEKVYKVRKLELDQEAYDNLRRLYNEDTRVVLSAAIESLSHPERWFWMLHAEQYHVQSWGASMRSIIRALGGYESLPINDVLRDDMTSGDELDAGIPYNSWLEENSEIFQNEKLIRGILMLYHMGAFTPDNLRVIFFDDSDMNIPAISHFLNSLAQIISFKDSYKQVDERVKECAVQSRRKANIKAGVVSGLASLSVLAEGIGFGVTTIATGSVITGLIGLGTSIVSGGLGAIGGTEIAVQAVSGRRMRRSGKKEAMVDEDEKVESDSTQVGEESLDPEVTDDDEEREIERSSLWKRVLEWIAGLILRMREDPIIVSETNVYDVGFGVSLDEYKREEGEGIIDFAERMERLEYEALIRFAGRGLQELIDEGGEDDDNNLRFWIGNAVSYLCYVKMSLNSIGDQDLSCYDRLIIALRVISLNLSEVIPTIKSYSFSPAFIKILKTYNKDDTLGADMLAERILVPWLGRKNREELIKMREQAS